MSGDFGGRFRITGCGRAGSRRLALGGHSIGGGASGDLGDCGVRGLLVVMFRNQVSLVVCRCGQR